MKKIIAVSILSVFGLYLTSCAGDSPKEKEKPLSEQLRNNKAEETPSAETTENGNPSYDPNRGEGKFKDVAVSEKLDAKMAEAGNKTFDVKCSACHKLTDEKLVGPGWKGVTSRHSASWILNFITNTDEMLNKDPKAQAQLEICLVRMPNQNLTDEEARSLFEFMRKNDGVK
jgi:mono/diheme cytochrome c family protein